MVLCRQILTLFCMTLPILAAGQSFASPDAQAPASEHQRPVAPLVAQQTAPAAPAPSGTDLIITKAPDLKPSAETLSQKPDSAQNAIPPQGIAAPLVQELRQPDIQTAAPAVGPQQNETISTRTPGPLGISYESDANAVKAIDRNLYLFSERMKQRFSMWLERSARYVDIMKGILREKSVPEELVFLPIVESGFNPQAYSHARAVGPWQFIEGTAKRYGLVVDWWRDERKDPMKSTHAAASYLRDLHKMFGSWNLALAAYNAGEGRIAKALRRSDSDTYWELLHTQQIRPETKEYVPRYIAATMIAQEPEKFGFSDLAYHEPMDYEEVTLHHPVDLDIIAKCAETDVKEIKDLNPELRRWSTPPNMSSYTIRIPADSRDLFIENLKEIPVKDRFSCDKYTVKKKETLKTVAKKLNVPVGTLVALNNMNGIEGLKPGDTIKVPPKDKFHTDLDDRMSAKKGKKVSAKKKGKIEPKTSKAGGKSKSKAKKVKTKKA
jgi:membrane-bound lytic murein transglycosylase D